MVFAELRATRDLRQHPGDLCEVLAGPNVDGGGDNIESLRRANAIVNI